MSIIDSPNDVGEASMLDMWRRMSPGAMLKQVDDLFETAGVDPADIDPVQRVTLAIQHAQLYEAALANVLREGAPVVIAEAVREIA